MTDYSFDPSPSDVADARACVAVALDDTAVWRAVSYTPDGRGGVTRTFTDNTIPVWVRNPGSKPSSYSRAPGETTYEWEFVCRVSDAIQAKDVLQYMGNNIEVTDITLNGTAAFAQLVFGKRVAA